MWRSEKGSSDNVTTFLDTVNARRLAEASPDGSSHVETVAKQVMELLQRKPGLARGDIQGALRLSADQCAAALGLLDWSEMIIKRDDYYYLTDFASDALRVFSLG